jgi:type IV secretory pathway TrbD component
VAVTVETPNGRPIEFTTGELTGALGDSITVLPLVVALGALTPLSVAHILLWFGVFQVVWGVAYGFPISVEPMKALAGLTVAGTISVGELAAAGLLAGGLLLLGGRAGVLTSIERFVAEPVVRGVQLAVALLLARAGLELGVADPGLAAAALALTVVMVALGAGRASALAVLGVGVAFALLEVGLPAPTVPAVTVFPAGLPELTGGAVEGVLAQLAMTVGNAVVATSLLTADLFDVEVEGDDLATSMGAMSLVAVPFGGLPMCHGSGGLAGKYAFGARTGGANVLLGGLYLLAALVADVVVAFPTAVLGVLLVLVGVELAKSAARTDRRLLTVGIGVVGLLVNVGVAFLGGLAVTLWLRRRPAGA